MRSVDEDLPDVGERVEMLRDLATYDGVVRAGDRGTVMIADPTGWSHEKLLVRWDAGKRSRLNPSVLRKLSVLEILAEWA